MITKISYPNVSKCIQETLLHQAISEGFITDDTTAMDATHIEARNEFSLGKLTTLSILFLERESGMVKYYKPK